jgi:hypothetical protein
MNSHPPTNHQEKVRRRETAHRLARLSLLSFLFTFLLARALVFLIMAHEIPNMYLFMQGTHVHHLNYGIFVLSIVAGYSVFRRPVGRAAEITAVAYGVAMALTFDEFGMWLHLGGSYWQRVSIDAVVVVAAVLGLIAFASTIKRFEAKHIWGFISLTVALIIFAFILIAAGDKLGAIVGPELHDLEVSSSP